MKFKSAGRLGLVIFLFLVSCNNIIERAASDYFCYKEGNWWQYISDNDTLIVEVEPLDTVLQVECFPISFGGYIKYLAKDSKCIAEYINIVYNFAGDDYTIIDNFIKRVELPLVKSNAWEDSLVDSLYVSGQWIKAKYYISGSVSEYAYLEDFDSDVYSIELNVIETLVSPDTTIIDTNNAVETYAPSVGLVRFDNEGIEYNLVDYEVQ